MKKNILLLFILFSINVFGQVGIETQTPTEAFDINTGSMRIRDLPENNSTNAIYTTPSGTVSSNKDQSFNASKVLVTDNNGVLGLVNLGGSSSGSSNISFDHFLDLYGTITSSGQTVPLGQTVDVNGLNNIEITVPAGEKRLIQFRFSGFSRGDKWGASNAATPAGHGYFSLWNITDNLKEISAMTSFFSRDGGGFFSAPILARFNKIIVLDNSSDTNSKTWTFTVRYTAVSNNYSSTKDHRINFNNDSFIGKDSNDQEALTSRLFIYVYKLD